MKSLDRILEYVASSPIGATRSEIYKTFDYCWQTVNASLYKLEKRGVIFKTGDTRLSVWDKPNSVYKVIED